MSRKKCSINENSLGGRLRIFREAQGYKLADFANLLGISHGSLSNIENNKQKPSAEPISSLIQNTNINIYWLFNGEGEPYLNNSVISDIKSEINDPYQELIEMARDVLMSQTEHSKAFSVNIRSFHKLCTIDKSSKCTEKNACDRTKLLEDKCDKLSNEINDLKNRLDRLNHHQEKKEDIERKVM